MIVKYFVLSVLLNPKLEQENMKESVVKFLMDQKVETR